MSFPGRGSIFHLTLPAAPAAIEALAKRSTSPALLYREPDLALRVIREEFNDEYRSIIIDDRALYEEVRSYVASISPALADRWVHVTRGVTAPAIGGWCTPVTTNAPSRARASTAVRTGRRVDPHGYRLTSHGMGRTLVLESLWVSEQ